MATPEWSSFFAQLVRDYLAAGAGDDGIPAALELPIVAQDNTAKQTRPCVVITCEPEPNAHPRLFVGSVTIELRTTVTEAGDEAAAAATVIGALETRLRDTVEFSTWSAALPEERRTGWIIIHYVLMPGVPEAQNEDHTQTRRLMLGLTVKVER